MIECYRNVSAIRIHPDLQGTLCVRKDSASALNNIHPTEALVGVVISDPAADFNAGTALLVDLHRQVEEYRRDHLCVRIKSLVCVPLIRVPRTVKNVRSCSLARIKLEP